MAGVLIGCRRQFYDVDFLSERGQSTTTQPDGWVVPARHASASSGCGIALTTGNIEARRAKGGCIGQAGLSESCLSSSSRMLQVPELCTLLAHEVSRTLVRDGCPPGWSPVVLVSGLNTSMAPLALENSIKAICGPAHPAAVCSVRACPAPTLHPHLIHLVHLAARNCNRRFCCGHVEHE